MSECYAFLDNQIYIELSKFNKNSIYNNWKWKMDPYFSLEQVEGKDIIIIIKDERLELDQDLSDKIIVSEQSGFYSNQVIDLNDNEYLFRHVRSKNGNVSLAFLVSKDWKNISLVADKTSTDGLLAFEYLYQIMPGVMLKYQALTIHSALMEYNGEAIAISAASGVGKTTHARLWREYKNALILNGDRMVCKRTQSGWTAYGTPWSGTSGEQINRSAPLKAFVVLQRGEENSVRRLAPMEAFPHILGQLLCPMWDRQLAETAMDELNQFLSDIPVYLLTCRPDKEAVDCLYHAVWEDEK